MGAHDTMWCHCMGTKEIQPIQVYRYTRLLHVEPWTGVQLHVGVYSTVGCIRKLHHILY